MADNTVTIVGNLTDDPELRFTPSGRPVANFTVAVNRRSRTPDGQWEDKLDGFFRCNCWADMAENSAETLRKGTRVLLTGRLQQRSWEDGEGKKRSAFEIQVDEVGPSLRWATAQVQKSKRSSGGASFNAPEPSQQPAQAQPAQAQPAQTQPPQGQPAVGDWTSPAPVPGPSDEASF